MKAYLRPFAIGAALAVPGCDQGRPPSTPPELALRCEDGIPGEFVTVSGLAELPEQIVLVSDSRDRKVVAVSLVDGTARPIAREGEGPGEYTVPGPFLTTNEGIWLYDVARRRLLRVESGDRLVAEEAIPEELFGHQPVAMIRGGGVAFEGPSTALGTGDSADVIVWQFGSPPTGTRIRVDATDRAVKAIVTKQAGVKRTARLMMREPFSLSDEWGVISDTLVLVVRGGRPLVEVYGLDGALVGQAEWGGTGQEPVTQADRDSLAATGIEVDWNLPQTKPLLVDGTGRADRQGRFWVASHGQSGAAVSYLVFGSSGRLEGTAHLPHGAAVLGFGSRSVYVGAVDENGLVRITRCSLDAQ